MKKKFDFQALILIGPSIVGMLLFFIAPTIWMVYLSFRSKPVSGIYVGLENYSRLLSSESYYLAVKNTVIFSVISIPLIVIGAMMFAVILNRKFSLQNVFRRSVVIPLIVPVASVILFFEILFDTKGVLNHLLQLNVRWLESDFAIVVIVIIFFWKNVGYNIILFLAGLQSIPKTYYELADLEGASKSYQFFGITMIYLAPTTFFVFVLSIVNSFKVFRELYLLAGNYPHESIYLLQHFMNNMFRKLDYGKLVVAALFMAVVITGIVLVMFLVQKKLVEAITE